MRSNKIFLCVAILTSVFASCQKMVSEDLNEDLPDPPVITTLDCRPTKIQGVDQSGDVNILNYSYSSTGSPENCIENSSDGSVFDWLMKPGTKRMDLIYDQWILFDDSGRVAKSRMLFIPYENDPHSTGYIETYTYNSSGYIVSVLTERDPNPLVTYTDSMHTVTTNTWVNGNLVKSTTEFLDGSYNEYNFTYDLSLSSRGKETMTNTYVTLLFPGFFNTGKGNANVLKTMSYKFKEPDGSIWSEGSEAYSEHVLDGQGNLTRYTINSESDGNSDIYVVTKLYRCF
ncbi:MAG: hypothetical protein ABW036_06580 [Flavitalea sp.]